MLGVGVARTAVFVLDAVACACCATQGLVRVAAPDNDYNEGPRPLTVDHHAYSGGQVGRKAVMKVTVNDNDYDPDADDFDSTPTAIIDTTTFIRPVGDVGTVTLSATSSFDADGDSVKCVECEVQWLRNGL